MELATKDSPSTQKGRTFLSWRIFMQPASLSQPCLTGMQLDDKPVTEGPSYLGAWSTEIGRTVILSFRLIVQSAWVR